MSNITLFSGANFTGDSQELEAGPHDLQQMNVNSLRVPLGWEVELHSGSGQSGENMTITRDTTNTGGFRTASVDIRASAVFFRIVATHSEKSLDVFGASQGDKASIIQFTWKGGDHQKFLLIRDDEGFYVICARHSGKVLDVALGGGLELRGRVIQFGLNGQDNQKFKISDSRGASRVEAKHSGRVWDIAGASKSDKANLIEHPWKDADNQRFELRDAESQLLLVRQGREVNDIGSFPKMTSFDIPPARSPHVLIGETWLPYFLIRDGGRPDSVKIKESPFYRLSRFGFWKQMFFQDVGQGVNMKKTFTYKTGLTTGNSTTIERTMSIKIGFEDNWKFTGSLISRTFTASVERATKVTITQEVTEAIEVIEQEERNFEPGPRRAEVRWMRGDLFVLSRMDGTEVLSWEVINKTQTSVSTFTG